MGYDIYWYEELIIKYKLNDLIFTKTIELSKTGEYTYGKEYRYPSDNDDDDDDDDDEVIYDDDMRKKHYDSFLDSTNSPLLIYENGECIAGFDEYRQRIKDEIQSDPCLCDMLSIIITIHKIDRRIWKDDLDYHPEFWECCKMEEIFLDRTVKTRIILTDVINAKKDIACISIFNIPKHLECIILCIGVWPLYAFDSFTEGMNLLDSIALDKGKPFHLIYTRYSEYILHFKYKNNVLLTDRNNYTIENYTETIPSYSYNKLYYLDNDQKKQSGNQYFGSKDEEYTRICFYHPTIVLKHIPTMNKIDEKFEVPIFSRFSVLEEKRINKLTFMHGMVMLTVPH